MIWSFYFHERRILSINYYYTLKNIFFIREYSSSKSSSFFFFFIFSGSYWLFLQYPFFLHPLIVQYISLLSFLAVSLYPCVQWQQKLRYKVDDYATFLQFRSHLLELLCWGPVSLAASTNFLTLSSILIDSYTTISTSMRRVYSMQIYLHTSFNLSNIHTSYFTRGEQYTKYILLWLIWQIFIVFLINLK